MRDVSPPEQRDLVTPSVFPIIGEIIEHMGADRVILGSDWPHMEGLQKPRDILEEVEQIPPAMQEKILYANATELNQRRPL